MASTDAGRLAFLHDVRSRWRRRAWRRGAATVGPSLDRRGAETLRRELRACIEARGGEASARARAAALAATYLFLEQSARETFLRLIADELAAPAGPALEAAQQIVAAETDEARARAIHSARAALEAPWVKLLTQFNALPDGTKFLVDLRSDLLRINDDSLELQLLEVDLKQLLTGWFDVGFLQLERVTWDSPASLLEKLARSEAVHAVSDWDDLKNRLDPDRRFFVFFHPRMPGEPLVFVQVALVSGLTTEIATLLDPDAPLIDPAEAETAVFYSISSVQPGLAGISLGGFLIKQVVDRLKTELPKLRTFATLSPIPGLRRWLEEELAAGGPNLSGIEREELTDVLASSPAADAALEERSRSALLHLCADYLLNARRPDGRALDPVANFHLANGAQIEQINWRADTSASGRESGLGLMVNYLYRLDSIEANHEAYVGEHTIRASSAVKQLAAGDAKSHRASA